VAHFDMSEVKDLARDLAAVSRQVRPDSKDIVAESTRRIVRQWRRNAEETALPHGRHYPKSIGYDGPTWTGMGWVAVAGPDAAMPQGGMGRGFEYGSINQDSPHLDGNRAADGEEKAFSRACERLGEQLLWSLIN